ncbi:elongation factor Ts, mitochondrial [Arctopsyche grandis]|uniref:elongation factor Ts, mitochondrial n=1 Tax=Arctopsyche grandis TaxID=121162 RepID=UPI00406D8366
MFIKFIRNFHTSRIFWSAETSALAKLRKKTGYTFSNCKKALEMHGNDLAKAEDWLHEQAQSLGWSKASKLAGRKTTQGLIALKYDGAHAALVEINCETDFVARNEKFIAMAEEAANACFKFAHSAAQAKGPITKMCFDTERLGSLHTSQGKTLAEQLVLMIGTVGENATLRRAECWKSAPGISLIGYTHPATSDVTPLSIGKYGGILAYTCEDKTVDSSVIGRKICQHIVGMNPTKVGKEDTDKPEKVSDDENCLIFQEYLLDPELQVNEVLKENKLNVLDFVRFECGQNLEVQTEEIKPKDGQPLENVQTCQ